MAGTGSDLKPSCLLSFPPTPLFSATPLARFMHIIRCFSCSYSFPIESIVIISATSRLPSFSICLHSPSSLSPPSSLASIGVQYGLLVSEGAKAPLHEQSIQWNEEICEALHCFMYSCSIMGHFRQAGEKREGAKLGDQRALASHGAAGYSQHKLPHTESLGAEEEEPRTETMYSDV